MWFEDLMGFKEQNPDQVRCNIELVGDKLISKVNKQAYTIGLLTTPSLHELRLASTYPDEGGLTMQLSEVVGDVQKLHCLAQNQGAFFQAASQFNLLEMVGPDVTPEEGVGRYAYDGTQGPAYAISCGAGTIYRNYFVDVNGRKGQYVDNQIDCLKELGQYFENDKNRWWTMTNGYALATLEGVKFISRTIGSLSTDEYEQLKACLRIGVQADSQVTINSSSNFVTQAYCSALPVAYSSIDAALWEPFARLVLEASYEATLFAALENRNRTGNKRVYLTLLGGGVFGNKIEWILESLEKALSRFRNSSLEVMLVSYGSSNPSVGQFIDNFTS
ncbi:hypothetical protein [Mangrovibacterium marinum]|uniref:hypothetical protein n=1 Tax=Mangrovibacterium marinum TaxID=1639118 RepID=UPI002A18B416|nr:hypothetical protein [Mangrovibacterium marinum]